MVDKVWDDALEGISIPVAVNEHDQLELKAYRDLIRYARWISKTFSVRGHWLLNEDDVLAEALFALARCIDRYLHTIEYDAFLAAAKASMKNAVRTLRTKAFYTHRKAELNQLDSLDAPLYGDGDYESLADTIPGGVEPELMYDSMERVAEIAKVLDPFSLRVLNAVLGGEPRVQMYLKLRQHRQRFIGSNALITVDSLVVARSLCEPEQKVREAYNEIRMALYG